MDIRTISRHPKPGTLAGWLFAVLLSSLVAGCGGGPGDADFPEAESTSTPKVDSIVARTGPIVTVRVGQTANLSDLNSYASSSKPLRFDWSFSARPDGSKAKLQHSTSANPSFVADVRGAYMVQLVVNDGDIYSQRAIQQVVATLAPERRTGPSNHQGLSSNCVECHSNELDASPGPGKIPGKSANHVATSSKCESCHTPMGFTLVSPSLDSLGDPVILPSGSPVEPFATSVDHQEVFGNCSSCHNGVLAVGKSDFHAPTNAECDDCHNTTSFLVLNPDGSFDHTGITRSCSGCHNGTVSRGKTPTPNDFPPGTHPVTNSECGDCHTTDSFLNAYPDHTSTVVTSVRCDSCHGVNAIGPITGHPIPAVDCGTCHSIVSFSMGGVFNHRLIEASVQSCESCHNDTTSINAPAKTPTPPHPSTTDDCGTCHNTVSFADAIFDHTGITSDCGVACHIADGSGTASGWPPSTPLYAHMPTVLDCSVCHTPGAFSTGTYDHAGVTNNCTTCHDDRISAGKPVNHIPTTPDNQDCADCHFSTTSFAGAIFSHAGISNNCVSCHDGGISIGKSGTHLPTTQDCVICHTTSDPFEPAVNFAHSGISDNCQSCHNGNPNYVAVGAIGKKVNHIPALGACDVCHNDTNPGGFSNTVFLSTQHVNITSGCEGCHTTQFLPLPSNPGANLVKDANHVPTGQDCDVCHTVAGFTPTTMAAHAGITGNCVSCHNGNFVALGAREKTPSPPHPVTSADCALCHNTTNFADAFVDHSDPAVLAVRCDSCHNGVDATGKIDKPNHVPTTEDCRVCHVPGGTFAPAVFNHKGIVNDCASCHNGVDATGTDAKTNPAHIPITQDCSVCHTPTSFANATFDHQGITNNCVTCHDGNTATGKGNFHVPTSADCVDCHQTTGFKPATFSHAGIVDNCASCHGAGFATPKKSGHVATNQDCGVCHNTSYFAPATFDHTGITNNCASCHDGVTATGKQDAVPAHVNTSLDCSSCHTTATFTGGTWTHDSSSANNCDTCHSPGSGATPKPGGHLSTTEQCDVCHTTNGWAPTNFSHSKQGNYPGNHRRDPGCNGCHRGAIGSGINSDNYPNKLRYAPFCAGCHANDFERKDKHRGGENGTVEQNKNCAGSGCHSVSDREF